MTVLQIITAAREKLAALKTSSHYSVEVALSLMRSDALAILDEMAAQIEAANTDPAYAKANPIGGVAGVFDAMASRLRAGEPLNSVLANYGYQKAGCACPYRRSVGGEDWCEFPGVKGMDYLQPEAYRNDD